MVDSSEALRVEEALQRQCQTLSTLCPLTNAQDYCASRFFWFYCSSDRWLWPGAESLTNKQKWPSAVVLQRTESRFSTYTKTTQIEVRIARPRSSCDGIRSGSLGGPANRPGRDAFLALKSLPQRKVESSFGGFRCMAPFTAMGGGKKLFVLLGSKKLGQWVGVLSHHPWCWISKHVLEHPQSCDLACAVRSVNSGPSPILC